MRQIAPPFAVLAAACAGAWLLAAPARGLAAGTVEALVAPKPPAQVPLGRRAGVGGRPGTAARPGMPAGVTGEILLPAKAVKAENTRKSAPPDPGGTREAVLAAPPRSTGQASPAARPPAPRPAAVSPAVPAAAPVMPEIPDFQRLSTGRPGTSPVGFPVGRPGMPANFGRPGTTPVGFPVGRPGMPANFGRPGTTPVGFPVGRPGMPANFGRPGTPPRGLRGAPPPGFPAAVDPSAAPAGDAVPFESLTVLEKELPRDLIYSRSPKFPENPAMLREDRDLKRVAREAFDLELYWRFWEAALVTLFTDGLNESVNYYAVALKFKAPAPDAAIEGEIEAAKRFMNRMVGREHVLLDRFPYLVVVASDTPGEDTFKNVRALGDVIKGKLEPPLPADGTAEVALGTRETSLSGAGAVKLGKGGAGGKPAPGGPDAPVAPAPLPDDEGDDEE